MYSYGPPHMAGQKQDDQLEHTFSSYMRIQDVAQKTYQRWWTIRRSGERGSGISVLAARHDDDVLCIPLSSSSSHTASMDFPDTLPPFVSKGLLDYILCLYRAVIGKFLLVSQHWHISMMDRVHRRASLIFLSLLLQQCSAHFVHHIFFV